MDDGTDPALVSSGPKSVLKRKYVQNSALSMDMENVDIMT